MSRDDQVAATPDKRGSATDTSAGGSRSSVGSAPGSAAATASPAHATDGTLCWCDPQAVAVLPDEPRHCFGGLHFFGERASCLCGEQGSPPEVAAGREGVVTVYDDLGQFLGCMGREVWDELLREGRAP